MVANTKFFDQLRDHSEIKLRILGKFLVPWSAKLGYKIRWRGETRLWYVDGFAGPGTYEDGADGSPLIGARRAQDVLLGRTGNVLGCVNVEADLARYRQLETNTQRFRQAGVPIHNLNGEFSEQTPRIMEIIGPEAPIALFIDPFGIKALDFSALSRLLSRSGETDLILTFQDTAVPRLVQNHSEYVAQAVGSSDWRRVWDSAGTDGLLDLFAANLRKAGDFLAVATYGVRGAREERPKYQLMMASRSYDAFELLNDFVAEEEDVLNWKAYTQSAQMSFFSDVDSYLEERELLQEIDKFGANHPQTTRKEIREHIVLYRWAEWHTKEINRGVAALIEMKRLERPVRGRIDTDTLRFN